MKQQSRYKKLSSDNWLILDPASKVFLGEKQEAATKEWLNELASVVLSPQVPLEVAELFETTKAMLAYGVFYYPLFQTGIEQLTRVQEAAVRIKCQLSGWKKKTWKYARAIDWLRSQKILSKAEAAKWHQFREARDYSSHIEEQYRITPAMALLSIKAGSNVISELFSK